MECTQVKKYFELNKDQEKIVTSAKILTKLIQNSQKEDAKFRRVRLENPKIQQAVVTQISAVDILLRAGFERKTIDGGEKILEYVPSLEHEKKSKDTIRQIEARLKRFAAAPVSGSTVFLNDVERQKRMEKAREKRKAEKAAKKESMKRWQEDKESRDMLAARNTAAKQNAIETGAGGFAPGPNVRIKRTVNPNPSKLLSQNQGSESIPNAEAVSEPTRDPPSQANASVGDNPVVSAIDRTISDDTKIPARQTNLVDTPMDSITPQNDEEWKALVAKIPFCGPSEGIRVTSTYWQRNQTSSIITSQSPACLKKLLRELDGMGEGLSTDSRCPIWVRFDDETPQYIRVIVSAALPGPTPYSGGLFCFDIYVPDEYPNVPPKVKLLTTGGGTVRFGPNLYNDGKVCLSLLGTWNGPKWNPGVSTLSQVLLSIQGLILGTEHPYFLEPGHGGWEGKVKEGDFSSTGKTLSGKVVKEDFHLPPEAAVYENNLRIGTIQFAMLEMMRSAQIEHSTHDRNKYLHPFQSAIQAHFYHNHQLVLNEVRSWTLLNHSFATGASSMVQQKSSRLETLCQVLEKELGQVQAPDPNEERKPAASSHSVKVKSTDATTDYVDAMECDQALKNMKLPPSDNDQKLPPPSSSSTGGKNHDHADSVPAVENNDVGSLDDLKKMMQDAASSNDFIRAGKLQEQITAIGDVECAMLDAAKQGNFVRAGKLQEQIQARLKAAFDTSSEIEKESQPLMNLMSGGGSSGAAFPMAVDSDDDEDEYSSEDEQFDSNAFQPPHIGGGYYGSQRQRNWGKGRTLRDETPPNGNTATAVGAAVSSVAATGAASTTITTMTTTVDDKDTKSSSGVTCRLRIRLPTSKTVTEVFGGNETIGDVYRRINPHVQVSNTDSGSNSDSARSNIASVVTRTQVATPYGTHMMDAPAFSRPLSLNGYTLLLTRPKREFSLEMDGTKKLQETDLFPSATIAVMMCEERGMVRRGDLEDRLDSAQGDAMDVDGLPYESLLELTERVGNSDVNWKEDDEKALQGKSCLLSPASHVAEVDKIEGGGDQEKKCPICLGDFDPADTQPSLRRLTSCRHSGNTFHEACLRTWMQKKASCPICKESLAAA